MRGTVELTSDAYLRVHRSRVPFVGPVADAPGSVVFIDLDLPSPATADDAAYLMKQIVSAPPGYFLQASDVLVRWPVGAEQDADLPVQAAGLAEALVQHSARRLRVGIVQFPFGAQPAIVWDDASHAGRDAELLARARAVELRTLLETGGGVWRPRGYHYALPSGEHSSAFVRLAQAFKRPRDAAALATWLYRVFQPGLAVVTDTPTLLPIVSAVEMAMQMADLPAPSVAMLTDYPTGHFEIEQAINDVQGSEHVLGLVSVSSSGTSARRMREALDRDGQPRFMLETFISRGTAGAAAIDPNEEVPTGLQPAWLKVQSDRELYANGDVCPLCRDPRRAPVVAIDPRSFEPMVLPRPDLITPAVLTAGGFRDLWLAYDRTASAGVHARPHATTQHLRSARPRLAVRCHPHWLLDDRRYEDVTGDTKSGSDAHAALLSAVRSRCEEIAREIVSGELAFRADPAYAPSAIDAFVVTEEDSEAAGFPEFMQAVKDGFGVGDVPVIPVPRPYARMGGDVVSALGGKRTVMVVTLGAITGTTMQQLLLGLHSVLPSLPEEMMVAGLVMHARVEDRREWDVLRNAYTRLGAIWLTPLPLSSPFDDEEGLLNVWVPDPSLGPAVDFYTRRLDFLNTSDPEWETRLDQPDTVDPWSVFWGMSDAIGSYTSKDAPRLRPGSFYGHRLRGCTTFAAVGVAVQLARQDHGDGTAPVFRQFEIPAILRSYFDPMIVVSILRWLDPHELWWGDRAGDAPNVLAETFERATPTDKKILLPEFLLAAALGKVPPDGQQWLIAVASHHLWCFEHGVGMDVDVHPWTEAEIGPVQLGLSLVRSDRSGAADHVSRASEQLRRATELLAQFEAVPEPGQSRATAMLVWGLEQFLRTGEPGGTG